MSEPQYRTKSGLQARILATNLNKENYPVAVVVTGFREEDELHSYTADLEYCAGGSNDKMDLVLVTAWDNFKEDDPVLVKTTNSHWITAHFKEISAEGTPRTFPLGTTSWTSNNRFDEWDECRRPTEEEIGEGQ